MCGRFCVRGRVSESRTDVLEPMMEGGGKMNFCGSD